MAAIASFRRAGAWALAASLLLLPGPGPAGANGHVPDSARLCSDRSDLPLDPAGLPKPALFACVDLSTGGPESPEISSHIELILNPHLTTLELFEAHSDIEEDFDAAVQAEAELSAPPSRKLVLLARLFLGPDVGGAGSVESGAQAGARFRIDSPNPREPVSAVLSVHLSGSMAHGSPTSGEANFSAGLRLLSVEDGASFPIHDDFWQARAAPEGSFSVGFDPSSLTPLPRGVAVDESFDVPVSLPTDTEFVFLADAFGSVEDDGDALRFFDTFRVTLTLDPANPDAEIRLVPEPSGLALLALGTLGLAVRGRRRASSRLRP